MKKLFSFRFDPELIDKIRRLAYQEERSLTAQIAYILTNFLKS